MSNNPNEAEDAEKVITPSEGIDPAIVEWYAIHGQHREYTKGRGAVGGYYFAQTDMRDLQELLEAQHQKWLKEVEERAPKDMEPSYGHGISGETLALSYTDKAVNENNAAWRAALRKDK